MSGTDTLHSEKKLEGLPNNPTFPEFNQNRLIFDLMDYESQRKNRIPDETQKLINKACNSGAFLEIMELLNEFVVAKKRYGTPPGLTSKDLQSIAPMQRRLQTLLALPLHELTPAHKDELKEVLRFLKSHDRTIQFWKDNLLLLNSKAFWDARLQTANAARQSTLQGIKDQWQSHYALAHYHSEDLNNYYVNYLLTIDDLVKEGKDKYPVANRYFDNIQAYKNNMQRIAIHSMIARIKAAEFYGDIEYDDVLKYTCQQIETEYALAQTGASITPRQGLSPHLLLAFAKHIDDYVRLHPEDIETINAQKQLKIKSPKNRRTENTVFAFFENIFPKLLEEATSPLSERLLTDLILGAKKEFDHSSILIKLKKLIQTLNEQHDQLIKDKAATKELTNYVNLANVKYDEAKQLIKRNIKEYLDDQYYDVLHQILSAKDDSIKRDKNYLNKVDALIKNIENARLFAVNHLNDHYFEAADIILAITKRLQLQISTEKPITALHCRLIYELLLTAYPSLNSMQKFQLEKNMLQLADFINDIKDNNIKVQHLIASRIEEAIIPLRGIETALRRHKFIAKEKWQAPAEINANTPNELRRVYLLISYVENVLLPGSVYSPAMTLEMFHENVALLDELNVLIYKLKGDKQQIVLLKKKREELQDKLEKIVLEKICESAPMKTHLLIPEKQMLDLDKINLLLEKARSFFRNPKHLERFTATITETCTTLSELYYINVLVSKKSLDDKYLEDLQHLLQFDVRKAIFKHPKLRDLRFLLKTSLECYDGKSTYLSSLLVHFFPDLKSADVYGHLITSYFNKRLARINEGHEISIDDYEFFNQYGYQPSANFLKQISFNNKDPWNAKTAASIELLGDENALSAYRLKGYTQLLEMEASEQLPQPEKLKKLAEFKQTLNPYRKPQGFLISPKFKNARNESCEDILVNTIQKRPPSSLLLELVTLSLHKEKLQDLRAKTAIVNLEKVENPLNQEWFYKLIPEPMSTAFLNTDADLITHKNLLEEFFGNKKMPELLAKIADTLKILKKIDKTITHENKISESNYQRIQNLVCAVKPFRECFIAFSQDNELIEYMQNIDDLTYKATLFINLKNPLEKHDLLSKIRGDYPTLHDALLTFIALSTNTQEATSNSLIKRNIEEYLEFCTTKILQPMIAATDDYNNKLPPHDLLDELTRVLSYLASPQLKKLLFENFKGETDANPHWWTLFNNIDDPHIINNLTQIAQENYVILKNPLFEPRQATRANPDFNPAERMHADNNPYLNNPIALLNGEGLIKNEHHDPKRPITRNPNYDVTLPISNDNPPFINNDVCFIHWSRSFMTILQFAREYCTLQKRLQIMLILDLLDSAGVPKHISRNYNFTALLEANQSPKVNAPLPKVPLEDLETPLLLKLWDKNITRAKSILGKGPIFSLINTFINLLVNLSNVILGRAAKNKGLGKDFQRRVSSLADIQHDINLTFKKRKTDDKAAIQQNFKTFKPIEEASILTLPLETITNKAYALHFSQLIETYIERKLNAKLLKTFITLSTTPSDELANNYINIMGQLGVKNERTCLKLYYVMQLYAALSPIQQDKKTMATFSKTLQEVSRNIGIQFNDQLNDDALKQLLQNINTLLTEKNRLKPLNADLNSLAPLLNNDPTIHSPPASP